MGGHWRVKPSAAHLRVASMPILLPKLGSREAWSRESTGTKGELDVSFGVDVVGGAEGDLVQVLNVAVFVDDDDALGEHSLAEGPDAVHYLACVASVGLADRLTIMRLWKTPAAGRLTSTISGNVSCMSGRKMRSTALPIQASSIGGLPTTVAA